MGEGWEPEGYRTSCVRWWMLAWCPLGVPPLEVPLATRLREHAPPGRGVGAGGYELGCQWLLLMEVQKWEPNEEQCYVRKAEEPTRPRSPARWD